MAALALAGCAAAGAHADDPTPAPTASAMLQPSLTVPLQDPVYSLAFDPTRNAVWYPDFVISGPAVLYEASATSGAVLAQFTLPESPTNGFESSVRVAPDGDVWVTEAYAVVRVTPSTGAVATISLPLATPGARADGTDPDAVGPGTWISSMTLTSTSVLIGRNGTPFLQQWSLSTMRPEADVALPDGYTAPIDMTTTPAGIAIQVPSLTTGSAKVITIPLPSGSTVPEAAGGTPLAPKYLTPRPGGDVSLMSTTGATVLRSMFPTAQVLNWMTPSGVTDRIPWPATTVQVQGPGRLSTTGVTPGPITSHVQAIVYAAQVAPDGSLWLVEGGGSNISLQKYAPSN